MGGGAGVEIHFGGSSREYRIPAGFELDVDYDAVVVTESGQISGKFLIRDLLLTSYQDAAVAKGVSGSLQDLIAEGFSWELQEWLDVREAQLTDIWLDSIELDSVVYGGGFVRHGAPDYVDISGTVQIGMEAQNDDGKALYDTITCDLGGVFLPSAEFEIAFNALDDPDRYEEEDGEYYDTIYDRYHDDEW